MITTQSIKSYYFPWLLAMMAIIGIQFVAGLLDDEQRERILSLQGITIYIGAVSISTILIGGTLHLFDKFYRPRRQTKLFKRISSIDLSEYGIYLNESKKQFMGRLHGYYLTLKPDSLPSGGDWILTNAFISPRDDQREIIIKLADKYEFNSADGIIWLTCKTKMRFGRKPKPERLKKDILEFVDELRFQGIKPLEVTE